MCGKEPNTTAEVNSAKCWAIPALVFSIIALIGFIAGSWVQAIGGLLACIGSSILICCGPKDGSAAGKGKEMAGFVLMLIGAITEIIGAVLGLILYFGTVTRCGQETCVMQGTPYETCVTPAQSAIDTCIGFLSIIIWPSIIIGGVSGIITLVAAVKAKQAHGSLGK